MMKNFAGDAKISDLLKMTNEVIGKLKKEII